MKILVLENSDADIAWFKFVCAPEHELFFEKTVYAALQVVKEKSPDICFIDNYLDTESGFSFLKELKILNPDIKTVILSGRIYLPAIIMAKSLHADHFLEKPITTDKLKEILGS